MIVPRIQVIVPTPAIPSTKQIDRIEQELNSRPTIPTQGQIKNYERTQIRQKPQPVDAEAVKKTLLDPVLFAKTWLGVDLWHKQVAILRDILSKRKTSAKACHASSKSFTAAVATLWFLASHTTEEEAIVITTAPTQKQVEKILWAEIHSLLGRSKYPFPKPTLTQLQIAPKRFAVGFTTSVQNSDEGVRFQGFHAKNILVILDEAPGVDGKLWEAIEGIMASGSVHILALGNPTISSGPFFDSFGVNRSQWATHSISAFDTPNFQGVKLTYQDATGQTVTVGDPNGKELVELTEEELNIAPTPYLCTRHWVRDRLIEWGPTHPSFQSRVLGNFASQAPDALLSLTWLELAKVRKPSSKIAKRFTAGLDVAGPGEDETVLVIRNGTHIVKTKAWPNADPRGELVQDLLPYKGLIDVNVDVCGIGYYLARHLEDNGFTVNDINVGESATDPDRYANKKAECYWGLRMFFESSTVSGLEDDRAISQLAGIRYKTNSRGQIVIESKEDAAKRGVKSPDRAEAIMLAFATSTQHSLFDWWAQQAEKMRNAIPSAPNTDARDLALAQRDESRWTEMNHPKPETQQELQAQIGIRGLGKVTTAPQQASCCPNCGNKYLTTFAERSWKCNVCGTSGIANMKYDTDGVLVSL